MIFQFYDSVEALEAQNLGHIHNIVSDLLAAHRAGHHLLIIDRDTSDWLVGNIEFNARDKAMLLSIRASYTQTANLIDDATSSILVQPSHLGGPQFRGRMFVLGIKDVDWRYFLQRPNLLVENSRYDGTLIEIVLSVVGERIGAPAISFDKRNGGGTGIFHVWQEQIDQGYIVCLVADSDKRHPDAALSDKFAEAIKYAAAKGRHLSYCLPLPCLEAENLIPLNVIEALPSCVEKANEISALKRIDAAEEAAGVPLNRRFIYFYDLKVGIKESDRECVNPAGGKEWYAERIAMGGNSAKHCGISSSLIYQLIDDDKARKLFSKEIKRNRKWISVFEEFFAAICWIGYAPRQYVL